MLALQNVWLACKSCFLGLLVRLPFCLGLLVRLLAPQAVLGLLVRLPLSSASLFACPFGLLRLEHKRLFH